MAVLAKLSQLVLLTSVPSLALGREPVLIIEDGAPIDPNVAMALAAEMQNMEHFVEGAGAELMDQQHQEEMQQHQVQTEQIAEKRGNLRHSHTSYHRVGRAHSNKGNSTSMDEAMRPISRAHAALASRSSRSSPKILDDDSEARRIFPAQHPMVARSLGSMDEEVAELRDQMDHGVEERHHSQAAASVADASESGRGVRIRRSAAAQRAQLGESSEALRHMETEREKMKAQRDSVHKVLRATAEKRLAREEHSLLHHRSKYAKAHEEVEHWTQLRDGYKASAQKAVIAKHSAATELQNAKAAAETAEKAEQAAEAKLEDATELALHDVQEYKVAETRLMASKSDEEREANRVKEEEEGLKHSREVYAEEERNFNKTMSAGEGRLAKRVTKLQKAQADAKKRLEKSKDSLADWQAEQRRRAEAKMAAAKAYEAKQEALSKQRKEVLAKAEKEATRNAISAAGFDDADWAWSEEGDTSADDA